MVSAAAEGLTGMAQWKDRPAYHQVADALRRRIHGDEFPVGAQLPSQAALMRDYNVSVTVVRMALDELGSEGLIRSQQGKGTFVHAAPSSPGEQSRHSPDFLALTEQLAGIEEHLSQIDERLDMLEGGVRPDQS